MPISHNDLLSIKDFSQLTGIKQSTLRYYDDLGLFSPAKRGENGYRYYSPQQIITINSINLLNELDMSIREISEIQKNRSPELLFHVLSEKEDRKSVV
jgi:DNA-binding transcriptional MerR regulator